VDSFARRHPIAWLLGKKAEENLERPSRGDRKFFDKEKLLEQEAHGGKK
jgi:hypothetical protein